MMSGARSLSRRELLERAAAFAAAAALPCPARVAARRPGRAFDVIVSADTLCYFGPLEDVVAAAAEALRPGGRLIFTVESMSGEGSDVGYFLGHHGRYTHARAYLECALAGAQLQPDFRSATLRLEAGDPVEGFVVRATKPKVRD